MNRTQVDNVYLKKFCVDFSNVSNGIGGAVISGLIVTGSVVGIDAVIVGVVVMGIVVFAIPHPIRNRASRKEMVALLQAFMIYPFCYLSTSPSASVRKRIAS